MCDIVRVVCEISRGCVGDTVRVVCVIQSELCG